MKLCVLLVSLFCGLTSAQDAVDASETEKTDTLQLCFPDMCKLLQEFGAMKEKLGAVEAKLEDSENQIRELKNKEHTSVVFTAAAGGNTVIGPFTSQTTLVSSAVKTNTGNAYNPATGIFIAPVAGIYYFTFFYNAGGDNIVSLNLMKNDQIIVSIHEYKSLPDGDDSGGNAAFVQLQQGDQVFIRLDANSHVWANSYSTTFSGFLVSKT